ncbi:MAG: ribonuclease [Gemmatimonadetes bacterium]|nr:ribonuclease [Gemmatimonadota bacterium]
MIIKGYRVGPLLKATGKEILNDNVLGLAAQAAYNAFFSIFPFFLFAAPLLSLFGDKAKTFSWLMNQLATIVPPEAIALVQSVIKDVVFSKNAPGLVSIGAVLALWSGSAVFGALMNTLNSAYNVTETRPWWKRILIQLASVFVMGLLVGVASIVMLAGPEIAKTLGTKLHLDRFFVLAWTVLQYPIAIGMIVAAFYLIYRYLPNIKQHPKQILVGASVATVLWLLVTWLFRLYVTDFATYNKTYGTIGGVIVLLTWMYLTMIVLLACGELNSELHHGTGAVEPRRGAVYAGRVVTSSNPGRSSTDMPISASASPTQLSSIGPTSTAPSSPRRDPER